MSSRITHTDLQTALPDVTSTLHMPGLQQPVDICRGSWGIPHIRADHEHRTHRSVVGRRAAFRGIAGIGRQHVVQLGDLLLQFQPAPARAKRTVRSMPPVGLNIRRMQSSRALAAGERRRKKSSSSASSRIVRSSPVPTFTCSLLRWKTSFAIFFSAFRIGPANAGLAG